MTFIVLQYYNGTQPMSVGVSPVIVLQYYNRTHKSTDFCSGCFFIILHYYKRTHKSPDSGFTTLFFRSPYLLLLLNSSSFLPCWHWASQNCRGSRLWRIAGSNCKLQRAGRTSESTENWQDWELAVRLRNCRKHWRLPKTMQIDIQHWDHIGVLFECADSE